jgi:hypothetical protein
MVEKFKMAPPTTEKLVTNIQYLNVFQTSVSFK